MPLSVVVTLAGDPQPPGDVLRRLEGIGLTLEWSKQMTQWTVKRPWPMHDRRWKWVQEQKYDPKSAHDIVGYIPNDCSVDQVPAYLTRMLREWPVDGAKELLHKMVEYNASDAPVQEAVEAAIEETVAEVTAPVKKKGRRTLVPKE